MHCHPKPSNWDNLCVDLSSHVTKWMFHCSHLFSKQLQLFCLWPALAQSYMGSALLESPALSSSTTALALTAAGKTSWGTAGIPGPTFLPGWREVVCNQGIWGTHFINTSHYVVLFHWQITLISIYLFWSHLNKPGRLGDIMNQVPMAWAGVLIPGSDPSSDAYSMSDIEGEENLRLTTLFP